MSERVDEGLPFNPSLVEGWNREEVPVEIKGWTVLFWRKHKDPELQGFEFTSFNIITHDNDKKPFEDESSTVELFVHGTASFDGVRHIYFGSEKTDNQGYFFYPDFNALQWIMKRLHELELEHCQHDQLQTKP